MQVSVILPVYNAEKYVMDAINSIINQTLKDWELIIVNDGSTDGTQGVIDEFDDSRVVSFSKENGGYATAMNVGISLAKSNLIARMDADDICDPDRLRELILASNKHPDAAFYSSIGYRITPGMKGYISKFSVQEEYVHIDWNDIIDGKRNFVDPASMFTKDKYLSVGGYRTYQRTGMDVDLWLRLMERYGPAIVVNKPLYGRRLVPTALVFQRNTENNNKIPRLLAKQRVDEGKEKFEKVRNSSIDSINHINSGSKTLSLGVAATCFWLGDYKGGWSFYKSAIHKQGILRSIKDFSSLIRKTISRWIHPVYERI